MNDRKALLLIAGVFLAFFFIPMDNPRVRSAILEAFYLTRDYARLHVLTCLVPAFFIAGAIAVFVSQGAVMKYFGAGANRILSYGVASVSGSVLAVCSCTVLPLFAGIYTRGAGIGPATAFLYSGPAINVLAIILTARVLGVQLGVARAVGAVVFSILIGIMMHVFFIKEERAKQAAGMQVPDEQEKRSLAQNGLYFLGMVLFLVFAAWGKPATEVGFFSSVFRIKWYLALAMLLSVGLMLKAWFDRQEMGIWVESTWGFTKQIMPLLLMGVLAAGLLMGRPNTDAGLIPAEYIAKLLGGNSLRANLIASVAGAFMYFATLTEVPIVEGLLGSGMGKGPALSLLLAGPALSLPNMLVIRSVMGNKKTLVFILLVIVMATVSGMIFGKLF
ncbi:MAG TPA: permease [bacterium]|nr:permease [bacterium]